MAISAALKPLDTLEWKLYDLYLGFSPSRPVPRDFLVISPERQEDTRRRTAQDAVLALRLLDEFQVGDLVLFGEPFEGGREMEELAALRSELPQIVDQQTSNIEENIRALFGAMRSGSIPPKELGKYVDNLVDIVQKER